MRPHDGRRGRDDHRRHGLTVVPHDQFKRRAPIVVPSTPRAVVTPLALQNAPVLTPQAPPPGRNERYRRPRDGAVEADGVSYRVRRPVQAEVQTPSVGMPAESPQPRREQLDAARRAQYDQMRRSQMEEARRGQGDQMRRMQMDDMRRARQTQMQAAQPAAVQPMAPPVQQMPQAQPEPRRIAPQPQPQPQMQMPAPQAAAPAAPRQRSMREESQRRNDRPGMDQH